MVKRKVKGKEKESNTKAKEIQEKEKESKEENNNECSKLRCKGNQRSFIKKISKRKVMKPPIRDKYLCKFPQKVFFKSLKIL